LLLCQLNVCFCSVQRNKLRGKVLTSSQKEEEQKWQAVVLVKAAAMGTEVPDQVEAEVLAVVLAVVEGVQEAVVVTMLVVIYLMVMLLDEVARLLNAFVAVKLLDVDAVVTLLDVDVELSLPN
jgi:hypothetical protein